MLNEETLDLRILLYHMILLHLLGSGVDNPLQEVLVRVTRPPSGAERQAAL